MQPMVTLADAIVKKVHESTWALQGKSNVTAKANMEAFKQIACLSMQDVAIKPTQIHFGDELPWVATYHYGLYIRPKLSHSPAPVQPARVEELAPKPPQRVEAFPPVRIVESPLLVEIDQSQLRLVVNFKGLVFSMQACKVQQQTMNDRPAMSTRSRITAPGA